MARFGLSLVCLPLESFDEWDGLSADEVDGLLLLDLSSNKFDRLFKNRECAALYSRFGFYFLLLFVLLPGLGSFLSPP